MTSIIDDQRRRSAEVLELWGRANTEIEELGIPTKLELSTPKMSIARLNRALTTRLEFLNSVRLAPTGSVDLLPENQSQAILTSLENMKQQVIGLRQKLKSIQAAGGVQDFSPANLQVTARNGTISDLPELNSLWTTSTNALGAFLALTPALGVGSTATMANRATALQRLKVRAETILKGMQDISAELETHSTDAASVLSDIKEASSKATADSESIKGLAAESQTLAGEAREKLGEIEQVLTRATQLQELVKEYDAELSRFDNQLTKRLETLSKADKKTEHAEKKNADREAEIERLITKSNSMIQGATVAGLAYSFSELAKNYGRETKWARLAFYVSIVVLFLSILPLATYLVPGARLVGDLGLPSRLREFLGDDNVSLAGVLGRLVILLPGSWLTGFCSRRYRKLFLLKEMYAHKAALAQSLEGFKREAPKFKQEVVAAVFWDLTQYSQHQSLDEAADSPDVPNPILRSLLRKLEASEQ